MTMPTHIVAVGGFVENSEGKILLVKTHHRGWEFPGGQVEVGENLIDALVREIKEESGIDVEVSQLISIYSNTGVYQWGDGVTTVPTKVMFDFSCKPVGGNLATSEETSDVQWVEKDKVLDMISRQASRIRFQAYLNFDGTISYKEYVTRPKFKIKYERSLS